MPKLNPHRPAGNFVAIYASRIRRPGESEAEALQRARRDLPTLARLADAEAGERRRRRQRPGDSLRLGA